jgi:hypothetical protein
MIVRSVRKRALIGVVAGILVTLATVSPASADAKPSASGNSASVRQAPAARSAANRVLSADAYCNGRSFPLDCWVHEPNVNQYATSYPIQFLHGDHVWVDAGGCVQTGGSGQTWKRYVDPWADNGLYHGLIQIPGAMGGLQQIRYSIGQTYYVSGNGGNLVLGYEDDGYGDNGYWGHDDGTGNQCKGSVNAWVHIVIS